MPIYEYRCEKCGQVNEFLILGKRGQLHCKECGGKNLTKLLSAHNTSNNTSQRFADPGSGAVWETQFMRHTGELLFGVGGVTSAPRQERGKSKYGAEW